MEMQRLIAARQALVMCARERAQDVGKVDAEAVGALEAIKTVTGSMRMQADAARETAL